MIDRQRQTDAPASRGLTGPGREVLGTDDFETNGPVADRVGFEPTVGFHLRRFSRPLP